MPGGPNTDTEVGGALRRRGAAAAAAEAAEAAGLRVLRAPDDARRRRDAEHPGQAQGAAAKPARDEEGRDAAWRTGAAATAPGEAGSSETSLTSARCESSPQSKSHEACGVRTATQGEPLVRERASERVREGKKSVSSVRFEVPCLCFLNPPPSKKKEEQKSSPATRRGRARPRAEEEELEPRVVGDDARVCEVAEVGLGGGDDEGGRGRRGCEVCVCGGEGEVRWG